MQLSPNAEVLKEPRGFIKLIEIILAICAFATAVGPQITVSFKCCNTHAQMFELSLQYPYRSGGTNATTEMCECITTSTVPTSVSLSSSGQTSNESTTSASVTPSTSLAPTSVATTHSPPTEFQLPTECQTSSEFYVFVGVTAFLFSLAAIVFYVFAHEQYAGLAIIPKADFVMTVIYTLFWLISSAAFAAALSKIKYSTDPKWLRTTQADFYPQCFSESGCVSNQDGNYATLNVSVIFGFLNMVVWGGNNWFLYKETNWFGTDGSPSSLPQQSVPPTSTSEIQPRV